MFSMVIPCKNELDALLVVVAAMVPALERDFGAGGFELILVDDCATDGTVAALREEDGLEIWLMGGGALFRTLLEAGLVDVVEVSLVPILLGKGLPFLPGLSSRMPLHLDEVRDLGSGMVQMVYGVRS